MKMDTKMALKLLLKYGSVTLASIEDYNSLHDLAADQGYKINEGRKTEYGWFVMLIRPKKQTMDPFC